MPKQASISPQNWGWLIAWAIAALACAKVLLPVAQSEFAVLQARWYIDQWRSGTAPPPSPQAWAKANMAIAEGLQSTPHNPILHEYMAYLHASRALQAEQLSALGLASSHMHQALESYRQSSAYRPMAGSAWAGQALASHYLLQWSQQIPDATPRTSTGALWASFDKALAFGQREPSIQTMLATIAFARHTEISADRQKAFQAMLQLIPVHARPPIIQLAKQYRQEEQLPW